MAASRANSAVPVGARPDRAPKVSSDVRATGPVWRCRDETKAAAAIEGRAEANRPCWAGSPASSA